MAMDTGNGATFGLANTTTTGWLFADMDLGEETRGKTPIEHLGTTLITYIKGDTREPGEFSGTMLVDAAVAPPDTSAAAELLTVTLPIGDSGNTQNAVFTASGFFTRVARMKLVNNQIQQYEVTFAYDGGYTDSTVTGTVPTFAVET